MFNPTSIKKFHMKKIYKILIGVLAIYPFISLNLYAQEKKSAEKTDYTFEEIQMRTPWAVSSNAAGLADYQFLNITSVGGFFNYQEGDYKNYNTAQSSNNFGVTTRAYKRVNKVLFYGDFTYKYDTKKDQTWLGTYIPDFTTNPILDSIPGKILSESYNMTGKIAYSLNNKTALGIGIDYHTATMAKRVDGRNSNVYSSITVKPGITRKAGNFIAGVNLNYKYDVDRVKYNFIGDITGKNIYYMEGLFFMSKSGITPTTILDRSYFMNSMGGAIQLDYLNNNFEFFNEFEFDYAKLNNYEGLSMTKRYSKEEKLGYRYSGAAKFLGDNSNHFVRLNLSNNERGSYYIINNYEVVPDEIKSWSYYEKGSILRYLTSLNELDASYRFCYKKTDWKYNFNITAGYNRLTSTKTYKVFPEKYKQNFTINTLYLEGRKYFYTTVNNTLELEAGIAYSKSGDDSYDLKTQSSGNLGMLQLNKSLLDMDYQYHNISSTKFNIGARYRHMLNQKNRALEFCLKYNKVTTEDLGDRSYFSISSNFIF